MKSYKNHLKKDSFDIYQLIILQKNILKNKGILTILILLFVSYNIIIYTQKSYTTAGKMSKEAIQGEELWQKNNCIACHQFYGLGGYLGPDLTNIISNKNKGPAYVKAFVNSGVKSMPKFNFSETEIKDLVEFLTHIDQTGYYPNYNAKKKLNGWVDIEYK